MEGEHCLHPRMMRQMPKKEKKMQPTGVGVFGWGGRAADREGVGVFYGCDNHQRCGHAHFSTP